MSHQIFIESPGAISREGLDHWVRALPSQATHDPRRKTMAARKKQQVDINDAPATTQEAMAAGDAPKARKAKQVGPATQKVINRILLMRKEGMGYPSIAKTLNDKKVATFGSGKTWHPPVVRGICLRHGVEKGEQAAK